MVKVREIRQDPSGAEIWILEGRVRDFKVAIGNIPFALVVSDNNFDAFEKMVVEVTMEPHCDSLSNTHTKIENHYLDCTFYCGPKPFPTYLSCSPFKLEKEEK